MKKTQSVDTVRVWDLPTRLFHWLLVVTVSGALATGLFAPTAWLDVHLYLGYGIVGLVVFRLIWGIFGGHFSRFRSFTYSISRILTHFYGLLRQRPQHYFGHNPSGSAMIILLLVTLIGLIISGFISLGGANKQGFLSGVVTSATGHAAIDVHEMLTYALMALIAAHLVGVIAESLVMGENLVNSMVTGDKGVPTGTTVEVMDRPRPLAASLCTLMIAAVMGAAIFVLARIPPLGVPNFPIDRFYAAECGDCHYAYSPSLLPEQSWRGLMASLKFHFGEDASLEPSDKMKIEDWLVARSAEHWDTRAAVRFREVSKEAPWQITAIPFWRDRHQDIDATVFARKGIQTKGNCIACHRDANDGLFYVGSTAIPER
jgi:cytochrome b